METAEPAIVTDRDALLHREMAYLLDTVHRFSREYRIQDRSGDYYAFCLGCRERSSATREFDARTLDALVIPHTSDCVAVHAARLMLENPPIARLAREERCEPKTPAGITHNERLEQHRLTRSGS